MIKNYFKIACRNLIRSKLYSFINIGGLSVGISVCLLIMVYVVHEISFDRFHEKADRIFSVAANINLDGKEFSMDRMSYESAPMIKDADPSVESFLRMKTIEEEKVIENIYSPDKKFSEKNFLFADSNFFSFFSFRLTRGDTKNILSRPFTMVLSKRAAVKYFGNENPVGQQLRYDGENSYEITGIAADPPSNSSIDFDFIGSVSSILPDSVSSGVPPTGKVGAGEFRTFLLLKNKDRLNSSESVIQKLADMPAEKFRYSLNAFVKRHLDSGNGATFRYMKIFSGVAILILLLALINYMSLATARSTTRSKEIGVRKVMGADRAKIIKQFYVESALFALISFVLGFLLFTVMKPWFYNMLRLRIDNVFLYSSFALSVFTGLLLLTILIAGSYPSLILSAFSPVKVLYGRFSKQRSGASVRKFFTVFQFTASIALIISSIIISRQLYFFRHADTGVNKENVVMIPYPEEISPHSLAFKKGIENINGINSAAIVQNLMYGPGDLVIGHVRGSKHGFPLPMMIADNSLIGLLGLEWKIPPVDKQVPEQKDQVVINEEAIGKFNLPQDPIGQEVYINDTVKVCGVLKNFNFISLHHKIEPLCLFVRSETDSSWRSDMGGCIYAKIDLHTNIPTIIESIRKIYNGFTAATPFEYQFMDDAFDAQYRTEERLAKIFSALTVLTIIIACMGLFGLAAFSATQRTKEIGVRKVLGASVISIVLMMSMNFIKLVVISIIIAIPIAWFFMSKWLEDFAYRVDIGWWVFIIAAAIALLIALITVSSQAIKAAIANPVRSLRTE